MKKLTVATLLVFLLAGCATSNRGTGSNYAPLVDRPGPNYATDLADCQNHAGQLASAGDGAAGGAVAGAVFGALLMAAVGGSSRDGAWVGALSGGTGGAVRAETDQRKVISRCMAGRGYTVLQ